MLSILPLLAAAVCAQTITLGNARFDLDGCASPSGTNGCYQQAGDDNVIQERACNSSSGGAACLIGAQARYYQDVTDCMAEGCWNRAFDCNYQIMLAEFVVDVIHMASFPSSTPPFYNPDYHQLPGSCVCNVPAAQLVILSDLTQQCSQTQNILQDFNPCVCCARASRLALLQSICPDNSLEALRVSSVVQQWAHDSQNSCPELQQSNWLDLYQSQCPNYGVQPANGSASGFLNPLSLSPSFPGTAPLSDLAGSVTALNEYMVNASTVVWSWGSEFITTLTFSSIDAGRTSASGARTTAATPSTGAQVTTLPGATTTVNGQLTTLSGTVATVSPTKTSSAEKLLPPIGLLVAMLLL